MDHRTAGRYWNSNADAWTRLAREGYDVFRDYLNTPAFMNMLPNVEGLAGLDIGCGEGHNTRLIARQGARITGVDIAENFIRHATATEHDEPLGIDYCVASGVELPFKNETYDFATGFMSFMDVPETGRLLSESFRILKPGGFLQFSITHPCFDPAYRMNLRDANGKKYAIAVGDYFRDLNGEISEWLFGAAPAHAREGLPYFRTPRFTHTLSYWLNLLITTGFNIERVEEPRPGDDAVRECPQLQGAQVVSYFLHLRVRKG